VHVTPTGETLTFFFSRLIFYKKQARRSKKRTRFSNMSTRYALPAPPRLLFGGDTQTHHTKATRDLIHGQKRPNTWPKETQHIASLASSLRPTQTHHTQQDLKRTFSFLFYFISTLLFFYTHTHTHTHTQHKRTTQSKILSGLVSLSFSIVEQERREASADACPGDHASAKLRRQELCVKRDLHSVKRDLHSVLRNQELQLAPPVGMGNMPSISLDSRPLLPL